MWTPSASYNLRMVPVSVDRGVSWLPATMTTGVSGRPVRSRCSCWKRNRIAGLVGRTEWKTSPAKRTSSGRCSSTSSTARRNASATSASRWFPPRGVCRSYWRKPRWRSARWASFTASLRPGELERSLLRHRHLHLALPRRPRHADAHRTAHRAVQLRALAERVELLPRKIAREPHRAAPGSALPLLGERDGLAGERRFDTEQHGRVRPGDADLLHGQLRLRLDGRARAQPLPEPHLVLGRPRVAHPYRPLGERKRHPLQVLPHLLGDGRRLAGDAAEPGA